LWIWLALGLALIAADALAQPFTCEQLRTYLNNGGLFPDERIWFNQNCVEEEEEEEEDGPDPGELIGMQEANPPKVTCPTLPSSILVKPDSPHTQCRQVGAAGVGDAKLIAQGIVDALDVYGWVDVPMQVCFRSQGRLKFLDASTAPRTVSDLAVERIDGMTCGQIDRVGTVVLLPGSDSAQETAVVASDSPPAPAATGPSSTTSCQLETTGYLSLRAGPSVNYSRLLSMPNGTRLVARARIGDWFMVNYKGQLGWASGSYLATSPGCEALGEAGAIILLPTTEPPAPEAEEAMTDTKETTSEADTTEMAESVAQAPTDCQLTAVDHLNLRAGPGLDYDILAEVPYEASLRATAKSGDWFKVEYEGQAGWVSREYVFRWGNCHALGEAEAMMPPSAMEPPAPEAEADGTEMTVPGARPLTGCNLRTGDIINLRQGPGLDYGIIAEIPYQTSLIPTERSGDWFKVEYEGDMGWVNIDYVFRNGACG